MSGSASERLAAAYAGGKHLCVGLDSDAARLPACVLPDGPSAERVIAFNAAIVEATADLVCAYKPNAAFYEALGTEGFHALAQTISDIRRLAPEAVVIVDAKRADIGSTNEGYVAVIFDELGADATTLHPYLGREALGPFLDRSDRLNFVLARTSNAGADEFQDLEVNGKPLYEHVARAVATDWNAHSNCGLVVGATYPRELKQLREAVGPDVPFLIPGVGAQGGDLEAVVDVHLSAGSNAMVINASRSIIFASDDEDFREAARSEAQALHAGISALFGR